VFANDRNGPPWGGGDGAVLQSPSPLSIPPIRALHVAVMVRPPGNRSRFFFFFVLHASGGVKEHSLAMVSMTYGVALESLGTGDLSGGPGRERIFFAGKRILDRSAPGPSHKRAGGRCSETRSPTALLVALFIIETVALRAEEAPNLNRTIPRPGPGVAQFFFLNA